MARIKMNMRKELMMRLKNRNRVMSLPMALWLMKRTKNALKVRSPKIHQSSGRKKRPNARRMVKTAAASDRINDTRNIFRNAFT